MSSSRHEPDIGNMKHDQTEDRMISEHLAVATIMISSMQHIPISIVPCTSLYFFRNFHLK